MEGSLVKWFTDRQSAAKINEVGSMKLDLHRLAIKIFQFCAEHSIRLEVQWIPRKENEKADYISRLIDFDDWHITPKLFLRLEELWGPHTVDCFANFDTAKLPRFFSHFWNPGASGIDFFVQNLESENCLVVHPVPLVERDKLYLIRSIRFSKQKSFHSFKTKGVSDFKTAFDLALHIVYRMSRQDNATFVEQSLSTEVFSYFYLP